MEKKGILAVSFGTSVEETRERTIDVIERDLAEAFPGRSLYRAWTSGQIIWKLRQERGISYDTVSEALERMRKDGITDVLVQPTHMLYGVETRRMMETLSQYREQFSAFRIGQPLLACPKDQEALMEAILKVFAGLREGEMLALMGHGSPQIPDGFYKGLEEIVKRKGHDNICVGTVEYAPGFDGVLRMAQERKPEKILLAPLMIVAGDHALNDMAGEEPGSWKSRLEAAGFRTESILKGLGEYADVRRIFVEHAGAAEAEPIPSKGDQAISFSGTDGETEK